MVLVLSTQIFPIVFIMPIQMYESGFKAAGR